MTSQIKKKYAVLFKNINKTIHSSIFLFPYIPQHVFIITLLEAPKEASVFYHMPLWVVSYHTSSNIKLLGETEIEPEILAG